MDNLEVSQSRRQDFEERGAGMGIEGGAGARMLALSPGATQRDGGAHSLPAAACFRPSDVKVYVKRSYPSLRISFTSAQRAMQCSRAHSLTLTVTSYLGKIGFLRRNAARVVFPGLPLHLRSADTGLGLSRYHALSS